MFKKFGKAEAEQDAVVEEAIRRMRGELSAQEVADQLPSIARSIGDGAYPPCEEGIMMLEMDCASLFRIARRVQAYQGAGASREEVDLVASAFGRIPDTTEDLDLAFMLLERYKNAA